MSHRDNPPGVKELQHQSWTSVTPGWRKHYEHMTRITAAVTEKLLDRAGIAVGSRVLDIASGTGQPAISAANRVGPTGSVLGTDFVEPMLAFAREKAAASRLSNVEFRCVDGEAIDLPEESFDAVTIRWGLMFMPDALACLRGAHRALRTGGRIAVSTWAGPDVNPWVRIPMTVVMKHTGATPPPPGTPGMFAYADPARLEDLLAQAGFHAVAVEAVQLMMADFDSADEYWSQTRELAGPIVALLASLSAEGQDSVAQEIAAELERVSGGPRVSLPGTSWVASGHK